MVFGRRACTPIEILDGNIIFVQIFQNFSLRKTLLINFVWFEIYRAVLQRKNKHINAHSKLFCRIIQYRQKAADV